MLVSTHVENVLSVSEADWRWNEKEESALLEMLEESNLSKEHLSKLGGIVKSIELRGELGLKF